MRFMKRLLFFLHKSKLPAFRNMSLETSLRRIEENVMRRALTWTKCSNLTNIMKLSFQEKIVQKVVKYQVQCFY